MGIPSERSGKNPFNHIIICFGEDANDADLRKRGYAAVMPQRNHLAGPSLA
jgi:hypothetical protein